MREHGGWENFVMIQIEEFPCETKREAEAREELAKGTKSNSKRTPMLYYS
jgi:hypothetical protein